MPITKAGNRLLKKYLYLAAEVARHWDPDFAAYYARRYARGDKHNRIIIALARKMALRVYTLLRRRGQAREKANQSTSQREPIRYILRDREGHPLDKKQARELILAQYTRAAADSERQKREGSRRKSWPPAKTRRRTPSPQKVEWPSKDATSGSQAPPSSIPLARRNHELNRDKIGSEFESLADVLERVMGKLAVQKP